MTIARADIRVGHVIDELDKMEPQSVHACMTSPPYWGLRDYKLPDQTWPDGWRGGLGLEPTIDLFVDHLVGVFDAVRRVLRDDGLCFVNLGDSYSQDHRQAPRDTNWGIHGSGDRGSGSRARDSKIPPLPGGNLCNVPHRFAMAMQSRGWYLRSTIVWAKGISFCPDYSGSVMPESVSGWRWERCRVKTAAGNKANRVGHTDTRTSRKPGADHSHSDTLDGGSGADWSPCPGCPKCEHNDGLVLKRGSWRSTSGYELIFQFAKSPDYYCDAEAIQEEGSGKSGGACFGKVELDGPGSRRCSDEENEAIRSGTRNPRSVWAIPTQAYPEAHFATWPEALVEPMIRVSTSENGVCPECGSQWARVLERSGQLSGRERNVGGRTDGLTRPPQWEKGENPTTTTTLGWRPTCGCVDGMHGTPGDKFFWPIPATVLDPFLGSGTTLLVARKLGRHSIGIELNPEYADMARRRVGDYAPLFTGAAE